jgi:hypothetical protein
MTNANPFAQFQQQQAQPAQPQNAATFGAAPAQGVANPFGQAPQTQQQAFTQPQQGFTGLPDFSDLNESSRAPLIPAGFFELEYTGNYIKTRKGHSVFISFKVVQSTNTMYPAGSDLDFMKKMPNDRTKIATAAGAVLACMRGLMGFADEATMKASVPQWNQYFTPLMAGQPADWLKGRRVYCKGTAGDLVIDQKTGRPKEPEERWTNYNWSPAPVAQ